MWFDGAKGRDARDFEYDWDRYYYLIRKLQPQACISICGPDIRWVGNEAGKCRKSEFSVVPLKLTWYPAEVDVSVREGWFYPGGGKTKSADELVLAK